MFINILESVWKEIGAIIGFILAGVMGYFIPQLSAKIKNILQQRWFNISLKKNMEVKIKMAELKTRVGCQRIYLMQFHNGKVFLGNNAFHKYSISTIFEIVNTGLSREIHNMQNIPMSNYAELMYMMMNDNKDIVVVGDHRGCDMTFEESDMETSRYATDAATIVFVKVKDKTDSFVGLLALYFDTEEPKGKIASEFEDLKDLNSMLVHIKNKM